MSTFDKQQLVQYLETVIPHQDNPESFHYQIDTEISRVLKQQEHTLKTQQSKTRFNQILESDFQKREKLKRQLQEKTRKGIQHKQKLIAERAKSLVQLNKRRQLLQREKSKQNRKAQLLKSLKKIEEFQAKKRAIQQFKINKSMSERALRSQSKLDQRKEAHDSQYNAIVDKLDSKGIFTLPSKQLQSIYSHKVSYRNQSQKKLKKMEEKLGVSLNKIQEARRKKEALLMQRSQKIQNNEKLQYQLKKGRWKELQTEQNEKRKELQIRQAKKILKAKAIQGGEYQRSLTQKDYEVEVLLGAEKVKVKNPSYKQQIRKHIDDFLKGKHA